MVCAGAYFNLGVHSLWSQFKLISEVPAVKPARVARWQDLRCGSWAMSSVNGLLATASCAYIEFALERNRGPVMNKYHHYHCRSFFSQLTQITTLGDAC
jgi:hypothetical protein